ncbi:DUF441 family protein [Arsenophonus symbiont of Ornithomya chloropus]|uniref:DUF441 family protein n=1 Tax=Arsenophonus symbiont of Ornithomya chloropus TaxID=634121 RepID=UPI0032B30B5F
MLSWLGSQGVFLIDYKAVMIIGLLFGTLIGVFIFHGVVVGPLIAVGILSLLIDNF